MHTHKQDVPPDSEDFSIVGEASLGQLWHHVTFFWVEIFQFCKKGLILHKILNKIGQNENVQLLPILPRLPGKMENNVKNT